MNYTGDIGPHHEAGPHQQELLEFGPRMFGELGKTFTAGQSDGSIRVDLDADLDAGLAAPALALFLLGFFRMMAETGEAFTKLLGIDGENFITFALSLLGDSLQPHGGSG